MADLSHRRTHNLLLISKLLDQRDHTSPFTLVLDDLEQPAKPLLREYIRRAKNGKANTVFLAFETLPEPSNIDAFVTCWDKTPIQISQAVAGAVTSKTAAGKRSLILIDSLGMLAALSNRPSADFSLTTFLSSLLQPPQKTSGSPMPVSLVAVYHTDVPLTSSIAYSPKPVALLSYLATTIITTHSVSTLLEEKTAKERSLAAPMFGLAEAAEGVLIGLKPSGRKLKPAERGIVLELEHRRKSGRGVHEWYFLPDSPARQPASVTPQALGETIVLLDDHPLFRKVKGEEGDNTIDLDVMTFELGLTDRQKQEREGVVLPYFDAQKAGGGTEGGRILYDMGAEDDFDDEEDEI